jgi:hypothetical protein
MSRKIKSTVLRKSILIGLISLGLVFFVISVLPEFFNAGKKGFGNTQWFFIRNGIFLFITGLVLSLFPGTIDYFKSTFSNDEYNEERLQHQKGMLSFSKHDFILIFLFLLAANFFAVYFIRKENFIYYWDFANFYSKYIEISTSLYQNPFKAIISTIGSMQSGEYSYFPILFLTPFAFVFGIERLPYILSVVNIFGFLSALSFLLLYKLFSGIMHNYKSSYGFSLIPLLTFFTFPFIWAAILYGYVGLGGFFIMCLILLFYFRFPLSAQRYSTLMAIGILLSVLVLFRRWYSFWTVSFIITLIVNETVFLYIDYRFDRKRLTVLVKKISFTLFIAGTFYVLIAGPRFLEIVSKDYSPLISVYNPYTLREHFIGFLNRFGLLYTTLGVSGLFISLYFKNSRKFASFLLIQWILTFVLFTRISYFSFQHYHILLPSILLFMSLFLTWLIMKAKSKIIKITIFTVCISVSAIIFSATFIPGASLYSYQNKLFPRLRYYPLVRSDIGEIKRMMNVLASILHDTNDRVYVLASSSLLNYDHFHKAPVSLKDIPRIGKHIFISSDLDLRDGFPHNLFKAKYVIVSDPIQCGHGCKKNQHVVSIPAESILKGENMGSSYERLPYEFILGPDGHKRDVKAYIYKRSDSPVQEDIKFLSDALRKHYPDKPHVYGANIE